jgi:cyclase
MGHLTEARLAPRLWVGTLGGDTMATSYGANCTAIAGDAGTLLVDPLIAPAHARLVAAALAAHGFPPVTHVLLTHHHTDHALGASLFAGARVLATPDCAAAMAAQHPALVAARRADPALAALFADAVPHAPTDVFADAATIDLGGLRVEVRRLGPAHTPGDAVAIVPALGAVICGDLVSVGYHFNYEEATPGRLLAALAELGALGGTLYVPGHGPAGGREIIDAQADYHRRAFAARSADELRRPGWLLEAALATAPLGWRGPEVPR